MRRTTLAIIAMLTLSTTSYAQLRKVRIGADSKQHITFSVGADKFVMETPTTAGLNITGGYTYFFIPRVGLRGQLQYSWSPDKEFNYHIHEIDLSAQVVGNYFIYSGGRNESAQGSSIPERGYAFAGIGMMGYFSSHNSYSPGVTMTIPVGTGLQWSVNDNWSVGAEIAYNFTITDRMDGLETTKFSDGFATLGIIATYKITGHTSYGGKTMHYNTKKKKSHVKCDPRHGCIRTFE